DYESLARASRIRRPRTRNGASRTTHLAHSRSVRSMSIQAGMAASVARRPGAISSAALALSGIGIALQPKQTAAALDLSTSSARGVAETRIGLGGTFAALGLWALARGSADAYTAVGMTWLGAAA